MKFIYLPLEFIDSRYTVHLDRDITSYLIDSGIKHIRIYPKIVERPVKKDCFLEASTTIQFKSMQIAKIAEMYYTDEIESGDIIFTSDIWFPGLCESVAYLNLFFNKDVKIRGILHAGSFTLSDSVNKLERWAKNFEEIVFDIADEIYVASDFLKSDVSSKRILNKDKLIVTPLPLDIETMSKYKSYDVREDIIIFNGRNHVEKQPWLFERLKIEVQKEFPNCRFIWTLDEGLSKEDYYKLLSKSKGVVSFAMQENFGFGIAEAVYLGCQPILPNRLVYPEMYPKQCLYDTFDQCIELTKNILKNYNTLSKVQVQSNHQSINRWFKV